MTQNSDVGTIPLRSHGSRTYGTLTAASRSPLDTWTRRAEIDLWGAGGPRGHRGPSCVSHSQEGSHVSVEPHEPAGMCRTLRCPGTTAELQDTRYQQGKALGQAQRLHGLGQSGGCGPRRLPDLRADWALSKTAHRLPRGDGVGRPLPTASLRTWSMRRTESGSSIPGKSHRLPCDAVLHLRRAAGRGPLGRGSMFCLTRSLVQPLKSSSRTAARVRLGFRLCLAKWGARSPSRPRRFQQRRAPGR
jgi:hypothetical protein